MIAFAALVITYFILLLAALAWLLASVQVARLKALDVRLVHATLGALLLGVMAALLLRLPLLVVMLLGVALLGLRNANARWAFHEWWYEVHEALAQRGWALDARDYPELTALVRSKMRKSGGYVYLGSERGRWITADPEHAVLVLGPPRQGKTSAIVIPTLLACGCPTLVTSTKPDVMANTLTVRGRLGICWLFDPSGGTPCPPGVRPLRWSPVPACKSWDRAVVLAHDIVTTARASADVRNASHWAERASALLAAFLHAAALDGLGMRDVVGWILRQDGATPHEILNRPDARTAWDVLDGIAKTAPEEQSGIWSTATSALSVYRSAAALALTDAPNFEPGAFVSSRDTIYVVASSQHQRVAQPMVVALLEEIRSATFAESARRYWTGERLDPPVLFLLDEVANIAPLPELPSVVSEGGGQGLVLVACLQDLSQAREQWKTRADGFPSLFGTMVLLRGLRDAVTLKAVSDLVGDHEVETVSVTKDAPAWWGRSRTQRDWDKLPGIRPKTASRQSDQGRRVQRTYSKRREPQLPINVIERGKPDHALLLRTGMPWQWLRLTPWFKTRPWRQLATVPPPASVSDDAVRSP